MVIQMGKTKAICLYFISMYWENMVVLSGPLVSGQPLFTCHYHMPVVHCQCQCQCHEHIVLGVMCQGITSKPTSLSPTANRKLLEQREEELQQQLRALKAKEASFTRTNSELTHRMQLYETRLQVLESEQNATREKVGVWGTTFSSVFKNEKENYICNVKLFHFPSMFFSIGH